MVTREEILQHHLDVILGKMFEMVNLDYKAVKDEYKDDPNWYWRNEWTKEQQKEFIEWLTQYLMGNSGARRAIMGFPHRGRKSCNGVAIFFESMYGWKTMKDEAEG